MLLRYEKDNWRRTHEKSRRVYATLRNARRTFFQDKQFVLTFLCALHATHITCFWGTRRTTDKGHTRKVEQRVTILCSTCRLHNFLKCPPKCWVKNVDYTTQDTVTEWRVYATLRKARRAFFWDKQFVLTFLRALNATHKTCFWGTRRTTDEGHTRKVDGYARS